MLEDNENYGQLAAMAWSMSAYAVQSCGYKRHALHRIPSCSTSIRALSHPASLHDASTAGGAG